MALLVSLAALASAQTIASVFPGPTRVPQPSPAASANPVTRDMIVLIKVTGELNILAESTAATYQAYFHIPIATSHQVPVVIEVVSPELVELSFVRQDDLNMLAVATLRSAPAPTPLTWNVWVLAYRNHMPDIINQAPIPTLDEIPADVRPWLQPTDCAQSTDEYVLGIAEQIGGGHTLLADLAQAVLDRAYAIPWQLPHRPMALDAFYALRWGSSCTGHANAATALFRANGVPARSLLVMPMVSENIDMHSLTEYWVPAYGWARMEPSTGSFWVDPTYEIVIFICRPEDEFPLFFPSGIEGHWHTSDPALGMYSPDWGGAHRAAKSEVLIASNDDIAHAMAVAQATLALETEAAGGQLTARQSMALDLARAARQRALTEFSRGDLEAFITEMELALEHLETIRLFPLTTTRFDDFEDSASGWSHGGAGDEWELGTPTMGPSGAHSGSNCWGTDLDGNYENDADSWLLSPPFNLDAMADAYLSFWVFNLVDDLNQGHVFDPLWMDITVNGTDFTPLCSAMGGGNDDPEIPLIGGWSHIVLDLTPYVGETTVQVRWRLQSDSSGNQPGAYLDDVHIYGRRFGQPMPSPRQPGARAE